MSITTLNNVKTNLGLTDNTYDTVIENLIPVVELDFFTIRNCNWDEDSNDDPDYPHNAEWIAAQMIWYKIQTRRNTGMKSESIGKYSYSALDDTDMINGYPKSIVGAIERFINFR